MSSGFLLECPATPPGVKSLSVAHASSSSFPFFPIQQWLLTMRRRRRIRKTSRHSRSNTACIHPAVSPRRNSLQFPRCTIACRVRRRQKSPDIQVRDVSLCASPQKMNANKGTAQAETTRYACSFCAFAGFFPSKLLSPRAMKRPASAPQCVFATQDGAVRASRPENHLTCWACHRRIAYGYGRYVDPDEVVSSNGQPVQGLSSEYSIICTRTFLPPHEPEIFSGPGFTFAVAPKG